MTSRQSTTGDGHGSQPLLVRHGPLIQAFGTLRLLPIALSHEARLHSCQLLNQILADTMILSQTAAGGRTRCGSEERREWCQGEVDWHLPPHSIRGEP